VVVVTDTSPIINLAAKGRIDQLRQLYTAISIPGAVDEEIVVNGAGQPGAVEVATESGFERRDVADVTLVNELLRQGLDRGEAEAIILAKEQRASLLLMDERLGRQVASRLGLPFTGLLGALLDAQGRGLISEVRPLLEALRTGAGFYLSPAGVAHVLALAGEEFCSRTASRVLLVRRLHVEVRSDAHHRAFARRLVQHPHQARQVEVGIAP
jgi:predicted nucleic acid-binding protein